VKNFIRFLWERSDTCIDRDSSNWSSRIRGSLIDTVYYIICSYIRKERDDENMNSVWENWNVNIYVRMIS